MAGFIGRHPARRLLEQVVEVVGIDNLNDYSWSGHLRIVEQLLRGTAPVAMDASAHAHAA